MNDALRLEAMFHLGTAIINDLGRKIGMTNTFACTKCGKTLTITGRKATVICPHCGQAHDVSVEGE